MDIEEFKAFSIANRKSLTPCYILLGLAYLLLAGLAGYFMYRAFDADSGNYVQQSVSDSSNVTNKVS